MNVEVSTEADAGSTVRLRPDVWLARAFLRRWLGRDGVEDELEDVFLRLSRLPAPTSLELTILRLCISVAEATPSTPRAPRPESSIARLYRALDLMAPRVRTLFVLRHIQRLSAEDIAEVLEAPMPGIARDLEYADEHLLAALGDPPTR